MTAVRFGKVVRWSAAVAVAVLFFLHPDLAFAQEDDPPDPIGACPAAGSFLSSSGTFSAAGAIYSPVGSAINFPPFRRRWRMASCRVEGNAHIIRMELDVQAQQTAQGSPGGEFYTIPSGLFYAGNLRDVARCDVQCYLRAGGYASGSGGAEGQGGPVPQQFEPQIDIDICSEPFLTGPTPRFPFNCSSLDAVGQTGIFLVPRVWADGETRPSPNIPGYDRCHQMSSDGGEIQAWRIFRCGGEDLDYSEGDGGGSASSSSFSGVTELTIQATISDGVQQSLSAELDLVASGGITLEAGDSTINIETGITVDELVSVVSDVTYASSVAIDVSLNQTLAASVSVEAPDINVTVSGGATAVEMGRVLGSVFSSLSIGGRGTTTANISVAYDPPDVDVDIDTSSLAQGTHIEGLAVTVSNSLQELGQFLYENREIDLNQLEALRGIAASIGLGSGSGSLVATVVGLDGGSIIVSVLSSLFGGGGGDGDGTLVAEVGTLESDILDDGAAQFLAGATAVVTGVERLEGTLDPAARLVFQSGVPSLTVSVGQTSTGSCPSSHEFSTQYLSAPLETSCHFQGGTFSSPTSGARCLNDRGRYSSSYVWVWGLRLGQDFKDLGSSYSRRTVTRAPTTYRTNADGEVTYRWNAVEFAGFQFCDLFEGPTFYLETLIRAFSAFLLGLVPFLVFTGRM